MDHFLEDKENRPLAVKLGTISATSSDVYSYPEDSLVHDSKLNEHLRHFGIDIYQVWRRQIRDEVLNINLFIRMDILQTYRNIFYIYILI